MILDGRNRIFTVHPVKRENESPEVILYEPNIISSPTRVSASTLTSPPTQVDAETIIESTKRQLRQRSDSKRSSATASPDVAKMEIKRENSEEVQSMEGKTQFFMYILFNYSR